jgi:rhodanese-related sulfurtransferase
VDHRERSGDMTDTDRVFEYLSGDSKVDGVPATVESSRAYFLAKVAAECDPGDVEHDLANDVPGVVVVDTRSAKAYAEAHVPGALNIWHFELTAEDTREFDPDVTYVTYGFGPDCNAGTKGALKLAALGFKVKEMIGGIEYWKREGFAVESGAAPQAG